MNNKNLSIKQYDSIKCKHNAVYCVCAHVIRHKQFEMNNSAPLSVYLNKYRLNIQYQYQYVYLRLEFLSKCSEKSDFFFCCFYYNVGGV